MIFPIGDPNDAYAQYFMRSELSGTHFVQPGEHVPMSPLNPAAATTGISITPIRAAGRSSSAVAGRGCYQEWGKEPVEILPGDVINIPTGVKHWHGAAPDSWFSHLAVEVPGENTSNEWLEPVKD